MMNRLRQGFCFFNKQISEGYGKKCCRYHQNGQPMPQKKAEDTFKQINQFISGWKLRNNGTRLVRHFYAQDYPLALNFLKEVVDLDKLQFKQCPTYKLQNGELLTLQLYSISLKGLSMTDFHFAMRINNIDYAKHCLLPIQDQTNYRGEVSLIRMDRQMAKGQQCK